MGYGERLGTKKEWLNEYWPRGSLPLGIIKFASDLRQICVRNKMKRLPIGLQTFSKLLTKIVFMWIKQKISII